MLINAVGNQSAFQQFSLNIPQQKPNIVFENLAETEIYVYNNLQQ